MKTQSELQIHLDNTVGDSNFDYNRFNYQITSIDDYKYYLKLLESQHRIEILQRKVSIIMVTYDASEIVETALKSIFSQSFTDFELIVLDGSPSSKTVKKVKDIAVSSCSHSSNCIILTGKDGGIYDAMNKAVDVSSGEWIIFMNAGDSFFDKNSLLRLVDATEFGDDFIYGNTVVTDGVKQRFVESGDNVLYLILGNLFCHQSVLIRAEVQKRLKYDTTYKIVADHNFYLRALMVDCSFMKINYNIALVDDGGVSSDAIHRTVERWLSVRSIIKKYDTNKLNLTDQFYRKLLSHDLIPGPIPFYLKNKDELQGLIDENG